jgi:hypothetical protein
MAAGTDLPRPGTVVRAPRIVIPYISLHCDSKRRGRIGATRSSGSRPANRDSEPYLNGDSRRMRTPNTLADARQRYPHRAADHGRHRRTPPNTPCSRPRWRGCELGASLDACRQAQRVPT